MKGSILACAVLTWPYVLAVSVQVPDTYRSRLTLDRPYLLMNQTVPLAAFCAVLALGFGVAAVRRRRRGLWGWSAGFGALALLLAAVSVLLALTIP
ncbi:hypothetical protein F8S09_14965 [Deinococcus sp. SDU3-2]|uniref:Uncharacterized protein n=1 Tax=Deinococcus terrestris TaxID=2651870 RepID=A0A7X1TSM2_9DEIO|nr:hypothetical protein [Deinococcus terrestris]MPY67960.1 hypothetical protein [Deinococcus terrestris]